MEGHIKQSIAGKLITPDSSQYRKEPLIDYEAMHQILDKPKTDKTEAKKNSLGLDEREETKQP